MVREELALFWEDLGQRFQKLGAGFRSALENYDSALQSHDRKHQELQQFLLRLALGRWWWATMKCLIARLTGMLSGMSTARIWAMKTGSLTVLLLRCVILACRSEGQWHQSASPLGADHRRLHVDR